MALLSTSQLIGFCRRVGTSLRSGVDIRRMFELESTHGSAHYRAAMQTIVDRIKQGESLAAAMRDAGCFPPVTLAMAEIGEHTGKTDQALLRLADHYEHQQSLRRQFLFFIAWPAFQLFAAVLLIGLLIYVFGAIASYHPGSEAIDVTGLGLSGMRGVLLYFLAVGAVATGVAAVVLALARGWFGPRPVQWAMHVPVLGPPLSHMAMSRLAWSLGMALDAGMDARRSAELSIVATQNPFYLSRSGAVVDAIAHNRQFYEAYRDAEGFPDEFLRELETAEIAGTLSESLVRMSRDYDERAKAALLVFTWFATIGVWILVAAIMIALIFRLFWIYMTPIWELLDETGGRGS